MNDNRDLERQLRTWLDENGPQDVPERIVDMAIAEASTSKRVRPLPRLLQPIISGVEAIAVARQVPVARAWVAIVLLLALLTASMVVAGAFLFQVDRIQNNGAIAYDADGDIYTIGGHLGDEPVQITSTLELEEANPLWSPDGRYLAYWVTDVDHSEVHVLDQLEGGTLKLRERDALLLPLYASISGWSPDSQRIAVPARGTSADGTRVGIETVVVFDVASGALEPIPVEEPVWSFGWSPNGKWLGLVGSGDLFIYDIESAELRPIRGQRAVADTGLPYWLRDIPPVFSKDGRAVLFTDESPGDGSHGDIWSFVVDDPTEEPVLISAYNELAPVTSVDGDLLSFGRSTAVSIDGALNAGSAGGSTTTDLLVVSADGGEESIVATDVWPRAAWAPDGSRLVTKSLEGNELVIVDLERPDDPLRVTVPFDIGGYSWGPQPP